MVGFEAVFAIAGGTGGYVRDSEKCCNCPIGCPYLFLKETTFFGFNANRCLAEATDKRIYDVPYLEDADKCDKLEDELYPLVMTGKIHLKPKPFGLSS